MLTLFQPRVQPLLLYTSSALVCIALRGRMLLRGPEGPMTVGGGRWPP